MDNVAFTLLSTFLISLLGLIGILFLAIKQKTIKRISGFLVPFSAGVLFGGAMFHLLPESAEMLKEQSYFYTVVGFVAFLIVEFAFHWHLCQECKIKPYTYLMILGDALHNILDGIIVASAYLISPYMGIVTTFLIFWHELPQQIGIFGVLFHGGFEPKKAIIFSYLAQSTVILGGVIGILLGNHKLIAPMFMGFAAGSFIYISASDLVPEIHKKDVKEKIMNIITFIIGLIVIHTMKLITKIL